MKNNLNQKGIAHHLLLIIIAVVAVIGAAGFLIWQRQRSNNLSADAASFNSSGQVVAATPGKGSPAPAAAPAPATPGKGSPATPSGPCVSRTFSMDSSKHESKGTCVTYIQQLIQYHDIGLVGGADGIFGKNTKAAVISFQSSKRINADGIVGSVTWGKLCEPKNGVYSQPLYSNAGCAIKLPPTPVSQSCDDNTFASEYRPNDHPLNTERYVQCVKVIQRFYNMWERYSSNPYRIDVDGRYGRQTKAAVDDFQYNNKLQRDSITGPATWKAFCGYANQLIQSRNIAAGDNEPYALRSEAGC